MTMRAKSISDQQARKRIYFVFLLGIALRIYRLGFQGLFLDEAWSWAVAQLPTTQILQLSLRDPHPPFYYLLLKLTLHSLPPTETGLRTLSVLCSILVLALTLVFTSRWWGTEAAFYAGWFVALSSFDVYYAQDTRMYTLLGLLWLLAYFLFIEALYGRPRLFVGWGLVNILMVWTHFYGIFAVSVHLVFGLFVWIKRPLNFNFFRRWLDVGIVLTIAGTVPVLVLLWNYRNSGAGGAWIPQPKDLASLFILWSVGLSAARSYFLDGSHLVLPLFATLPLWIWILLGTLLNGVFAAREILHGLRSDDAHRTAAWLALLLITIPILIPFSYGMIFNRRVWAFKPFLGAAYLFYLWAGIGLSRLSCHLIRRSVAVVMLIVALFSLIPYYTTWKKTDAVIAFRSLPPDEHGLVLLERAYRAPVAFYYLGPDAEIWGIKGEKNNFTLVRISADNSLLGTLSPASCNDIQEITNVWIYGPTERIRREYKYWPSCLVEKHLWVFEENMWIPLKD